MPKLQKHLVSKRDVSVMRIQKRENKGRRFAFWGKSRLRRTGIEAFQRKVYTT
jgi:hypothetical protein